MSSPATAAFLSAFRAYDAQIVTLAKIELSVPSARTLRYATAEINTPDGSTWQYGLICDPIRASIDWLGPGISPAEATIWLANRRDASQSSGTLLNLRSAFLWQNAIVTLYIWVTSLQSFTDALQVFRGKVSKPGKTDREGMTLNLLQDQSWNSQLPPVVDKTNYPDSPDVSQGLPVPILYGDFSAPPMRAPWTSAYGSKKDQEDSGAGAGAVPYILVDSGIGASKVKLVVACHQVTDIVDRANGRSVFIAGDGVLDPLDTTGITETLGGSEASLTFDDETIIAFAPVNEIDVRAAGGGNTATNPRRAMDVNDETSFASLDQSTTKNELQLILPNLSPRGRIESVEFVVAFKGNASNTHNLRVNAFTPGGGAGGSPATFASTGTTPAIQRATWPTGYWTQNWDFGGGGTIFDIRVDFAGGTANKASIYWVALVVKYRPQRSVVTPGAIVVNPLAPRGHERDPRNPQKVNVGARLRLDGQFYGCPKGYKDDGSGTFTGSASSLIQRPPDIMRHFLVTWGLISGSDVETGAGATGSFVDARDVLRNEQPSDAKLACWIGERSTVQRVLQKMAEQSGMAVYLDRFANKWLAFPWKPGAAEDYGWKLSYQDLMAFSHDEFSVVETRRAIRVKYWYDHFRSKYLYEAFVNPAGSGQGISLPTARDQRLVIATGVNDKFDWKSGVTTFAATLAAGTYAPIDLASEWRSKVRAQEVDNSKFTGWGFSIKTGFNDLFDIEVSGTPFQATLRPGDYTAEGAAIELARALNAIPSTGRTFSASYDHPTNKFTAAAVGGTFKIPGLGGAPGIASSALPVFGYNFSLVAGLTGTSITSTHARYGDRFYIGDGDGNVTTNNFLWGTGANAATSCADVVGSAHADVTGGICPLVHGDFTRGDRERTAQTLDGYYDPREENQISADWIRDELTAVELRDRIFDLTARPRVQVRFVSRRVPDLRLMQVIEFQNDLDPINPYPGFGSDGSWAGKTFRVLEVEQQLGPDYSTEVLAVEA